MLMIIGGSLLIGFAVGIGAYKYHINKQKYPYGKPSKDQDFLDGEKLVKSPFKRKKLREKYKKQKR